MNKQSVLERIKQAAFKEELEKIAFKDRPTLGGRMADTGLAIGGSLGGLTGLGMLLAKKTKSGTIGSSIRNTMDRLSRTGKAGNVAAAILSVAPLIAAVGAGSRAAVGAGRLIKPVE